VHCGVQVVYRLIMGTIDLTDAGVRRAGMGHGGKREELKLGETSGVVEARVAKDGGESEFDGWKRVGDSGEK